jgi:hypothetical protein
MITGALKSKTVWFNVILAVVAGLEVSGAHLTALWGPKVAAGIMLAGSITNLALRAVTTTALSEK